MAVGLLLVPACGQSDESDARPSAEGASGDRDVCQVVERILEVDDEATAIISESMYQSQGELLDDSATFEAWREEIMALVPEGEALYRELEDLVPDELKEHVAVMSQMGEVTFEILATMDDPAGLEDEMTAALDASEIGPDEVRTAVFEVDHYTREQCDLGFVS